MPVDTHVHRVTTRLGMLPPRTPLPKAHDLLEEVLEPDEMYPFHVETIRHGRDTCRAPRPICGLCPLTDVCAYFVLAAKGKAPMAPVPQVMQPRMARRATTTSSSTAGRRRRNGGQPRRSRRLKPQVPIRTPPIASARDATIPTGSQLPTIGCPVVSGQREVR